MGLIDGVVGCIARPARRKAENAGRETQHAACFAVAHFHGEVDEGTRVGELAEHNQEDDEGRDP